MFMKRLLFIYNPHAGKELLKPKLADVIDIFVKAGYEVVAYPTQAYRDAYKKIKKYDPTMMYSILEKFRNKNHVIWSSYAKDMRETSK